MKKKNLLTLLGIALVVAIISTGVFYGLFVSNLKSSAPGKTLVVSAKALPAGTVLSATDLGTIPWASEKLPAGTFERVEEVTGKTLFNGVGQTEPIMASQLVSAQGAGQASGIPSGMRAVSVHVTDSNGVLAVLRSGHKVDVQVVVSRTGKAVDSALRTILEDLEVLSVNPKPEQTSQGHNLPVVTLIAAPQDADVLALADAGARVRLTLRNPLDEATRTRAPLTLNNVVRPTGQ